jgi:hypothetical protein
LPGVADWAAAPALGRVYCTGLNYSMAVANRACAGRIHPARRLSSGQSGEIRMVLILRVSVTCLDVMPTGRLRLRAPLGGHSKTRKRD